MALKIPKHIAIIMDGNGRWAEGRGFGRTRGHREGARRVDDIVTACRELGVEYLSLYAFSTENWNRPTQEVSLLWRLLVQHLKTMDKKLLRNQVGLTAQGSLHRLPHFATQELRRVSRMTQRPDNRMVLNLCLSYGGREEIVDAVKKIADKIAVGELSPSDINEELFRSHLYQPDIPDPDLLIRSGGEYRVSNFLLWEIAYTEWVVTDTLWPEFTPSELRSCLEEYSSRDRRFGLTQAQVVASQPNMGGVH